MTLIALPWKDMPNSTASTVALSRGEASIGRPLHPIFMSAALLPVPASFCARHPGRGGRPAAWVGGLTSLSLLRAPGSAPSIANRPFNVTPCATLHAGPLAPSHGVRHHGGPKRHRR